MDKNIKTPLIIGGIIIVVLIVLSLVMGAVSGWQGGGWGMMGPGMMGGFGWWWFMPIFMIIFWGLVIWGIVALVRGLSGSRSSDSGSSRPDSALEVLKKRYARGEIDKEEYEQELVEIKEEAGKSVFQTAWEEGQSLDLDGAVLLATEDPFLPTTS